MGLGLGNMHLLAKGSVGMSQHVQKSVDQFVPAEIKFRPDVETFDAANLDAAPTRVYQTAPI